MGGLLLCAAAMATLAALLLPAADAGQTRWNGKAVDTSFNMARRCVHAVCTCVKHCACMRARLHTGMLAQTSSDYASPNAGHAQHVRGAALVCTCTFSTSGEVQ